MAVKHCILNFFEKPLVLVARHDQSNCRPTIISVQALGSATGWQEEAEPPQGETGRFLSDMLVKPASVDVTFLGPSLHMLSRLFGDVSPLCLCQSVHIVIYINNPQEGKTQASLAKLTTSRS